MQAYATNPPHPTIELLQEFKQSILTLSPKGADMPFHQHLSSWLYLAHGRKFWLLSEPEISPPPELLWNDLQDVIKDWPDEMALPSGTCHHSAPTFQRKPSIAARFTLHVPRMRNVSVLSARAF